MSLLTTVLLLWGLTLRPATAQFDGTSEAILRLDPQSLLEPWANLTLTCEASFPTKSFQLIMNGWRLHQVNLQKYVLSHQFPLGPITSSNSGLYRCRYGVEPPTTELNELNKWTMLSNLVEVTGTEPLPRPSLSVQPVPWVVPLLGTHLRCHSALRGVTFMLRLEGDDSFLKEITAQDKDQAWFAVYKPGTYSCSYRTHAEGTPSEPSAPVIIKAYTKPPPPILDFFGNYPQVKFQTTLEILACRAPMNVHDFQLRRGERVLNVRGVSPLRDLMIYHLNFTELEDQGPFTCRYRIHRKVEGWSEDSEPVELMWSDETLPAPVLTAEPSSKNLEPGSTVRLRCTAPKDGLRFGLQRQGDIIEDPLIQMLKPAGTEAVFELHDVSTIDSGNYSCVYMEQTPPFSGSAPSKILELLVNGPPPKPKLEALWTGKVPLGHEAKFRCHGHVPKVSMELVREGYRLPFWMSSAMRSTWAELKLPFVGPQHTGNYSCRYTAESPFEFVSGTSDPVELIVEDI